MISGHSIFRHLVICQHTAFIDTTISDGNDHVLKLCVKTDRAVLAGILRHLMCDRDDLAFFRLELRRQIYDLFIRFALPVQHPCIIKLLWRAEGNLLIATVRYDKCKKEHHPYPDRYGNDRQYIQLSKTPFIHRLLYHPKMPHGFLDAVLFYRIRTVRSSLSHFLCADAHRNTVLYIS